MGGDVKFLRTKLSAAYYKPLLFKSVILGLSGEVGHISGLGDKVTQSKRFYLGGRTIRGFDGAGIGPRDAGSGDSVGGNTMYSGRVEVLSSLGLNKDTGCAGPSLAILVLFGVRITQQMLLRQMQMIFEQVLVLVFIGQQQLGHYLFLGQIR